MSYVWLAPGYFRAAAAVKAAPATAKMTPV